MTLRRRASNVGAVPQCLVVHLFLIKRFGILLGSVTGMMACGCEQRSPVSETGNGEPTQLMEPNKADYGSSLASAQIRVVDGGEAGNVTTVNVKVGVRMSFCYVPPGVFVMGSPGTEKGRLADEKQVPVRITKGFWMAQTETTQEQWEAVMGNNPSEFKGRRLPVENVSWKEAQQFIARLKGAIRLLDGWEFGLPTEAQWEHACRAGSRSVFSHGDGLSSAQANFDGGYPFGGAEKGPFVRKTMAVASFQPNRWGLYDMHGNVWEWCADRYIRSLVGGADPVGASTGAIRVCRGGAWDHTGADCRSANRNIGEPGDRSNDLGFRIALLPSP